VERREGEMGEERVRIYKSVCERTRARERARKSERKSTRERESGRGACEK